MTNPNQHFQRDDTLERIEALRDQILETHEDHHDEHTEQRADYRDDEAARRASEHQHDDERYGYDGHQLDHGSGSHMGL